MSILDRRNFLLAGACALPVLACDLTAQTSALPQTTAASALPATFPMQPTEMVHEMVTVSHFSLERVKKLVDGRPSLANAAWDWGFGDWETALGAASHMGNRAIAEYLIANGARPSVFSAAMLGQLEVVKAFVAAQPGIQRIPGPHSIPLLAHAQHGGAQAKPVLDFLASLGDAGGPAPAPLSDADIAAISGAYEFGNGANDRITVATDKSYLMWTRQGSSGRPLIHLGDRVFHPSGAAAVRIAFTSDAMTVSDADLKVVAKKLTAPGRKS
jgi:hypothetical protein